MGRLRAAGLASAGLILGLNVVPAAAQFGGIFGDPPRPPAGVGRVAPGRMQPLPPPPLEEEPATLPPPPLVQTPPGASPAVAPVESQPLPPPPGGATPDQAAVQPGGPSPGAPGQPPPGRGRGGQQPASTAPQPGDEVVTEMPTQKIANPKAVFSGLDKITGRITTFDVSIDETVQFGALRVRPRACYTRPPTETANTDGFIEVDEVTLQGEVKRIFTGWMFAASPGLHGIEHPIYDVWLTDCKGAVPTVADVQPAPPPPRATRQPTTAQRQPTTAQRQLVRPAVPLGAPPARAQ